MYNIPNDNYKDFRINAFAKYYSKKHSHNDSDVYNLKSLCSSTNLDSYVWAAFLYSTCYSVQTTALLMSYFPDIQSATQEKLRKFWEIYKSRLIFQSDRRYVKIMDKFVHIVESYKSKVQEKSQSEIILGLMKESQSCVYRWFTSIYYCGRFSAMLFMEAVYGLFGIDLTQESYLDWNSCKTCAQGIFVIFYQDNLSNEISKRNPTKTEKKWLEWALSEIIQYTEKYLGFKANFARIIGYLCSYFKLYKQTRYLEFYTDRRLEELRHYEKVLPEFDFLWKKLYHIRKQNVPNEILGEIKGWNGIRKEKCKEFVLYGKI